ncbi:MAG: SurA N-terminal domain-containing protein [Candidatus Cloacimonetes bacterium]|nr:SurA N-terminal domain-containing protein [Candidatus Cloacimonadota bacterium]
MKKTFLILFMLIPLVIFSKIIAEVGDYKITSSQLHSKMRELRNIYSSEELSENALNTLIEDCLLLEYAARNEINVSEKEIETFMISQLGDHPSLQTDGVFDYEKYLKLSSSKKGEKISNEIKTDLLQSKSKSLIESTFELDDESLLEQYFLEHVKIDISYAVLDVEDISISMDLTPEKAYLIFDENKEKILSVPKINIEFAIIEKKTFEKKAKAISNNKVIELSINDTLFTETQIDSLQNHYIQFYQDSLSNEFASRLIKDKENQEYETLFWETGFVNSSEELGKLFQENSIVEKAFDQPFNKTSKIETKEEIILFSLKDFKEPEPCTLKNDSNRIWKYFLRFNSLQETKFDRKKYFETNIDEYIVPVAVITEIILPTNSTNLLKQIKEQIKSNLNNDNDLKQIIKSHKLTAYNKIIYLKRYKNATALYDKISLAIQNGNDHGFLKNESKEIFYKYTTLFPEFIPDYNDIKDQIKSSVQRGQIDTLGFKNYFDEHKKRFKTSDSLRIGGFVSKINIDTLHIEDDEIKDYFDGNRKKYIRKKSLKFDYIFLEDINNRNLIENIMNLRNFSTLKNAFNQKDLFQTNNIIEYNTLPDTIANVLMEMGENELSQFIEYGNGYVFLLKEKDFSDGLLYFSEVKDEIAKKMKTAIADKIAVQRAKTVFDSSRYFSHCYKYASDDEIFKTEFHDVNEKFEIIGFLSDKKDFLRLWNNEKYSSILKLDNAYAVVFVIKKSVSKQISYEDAIPLIEDIYLAENRFDIARNYSNYLRDRLKNGDDPDSLFHFFGGWKKLIDLSLKSSLPDIEYSSIIMEDVSKHDADYLSPVLKISKNQLFLYRIDRKNKISKTEFNLVKNEYKLQVVERKYKNWISNFQSIIGVKIK